jgi:environmental stress-induced protein Ves
VSAFLHLSGQARTAQPWRNGGGITREIIAVPAGAGDDDFLWRASIATISAAGPFSLWPGVDRALLPLCGELRLTIGNEPERQVEVGEPAILFGGEEAVAAHTVGGPCTVFNLMVRRGRMRMRVERWMAARASIAGQCLLLAEQPTTVRIDSQTADLARDDTLLLSPAADTRLEFDQPLIVAELFS